MDYREDQGETTTARGSWKRKQESEFGDQNKRRNLRVLEYQNDHVRSNSSTSFSMSAQTLPSSSKLCSNHWNHDVFLSFRGEDTRKSFADHLYNALVKAGINTFRDDDELPRGENISTELLKAIRKSRISIVIFSKGYASSRWCLDELVEILHCMKTKGHTLLPIFYHVNPTDVRKQTGIFAEAFARHEERFHMDMKRVQRWKTALTEAANCSGWDLESVANGYESNFIEKIVQEVSSKVKPGELYIAEHPIGLDSRVKEVKALLNLGTSDVRIVGIYGMGGIGKTTLAKAVYNQICDGFEGSSFLLNVKDMSEQPNGLVCLQEQLLSDILRMENLKTGNVDKGINLIKQRFPRKRVLVVIDDVDHLKQLQALVGNSKWFGPGSRIIATTRDEHVLTELGVNEKYKIMELIHSDALQLFCWHAFKMPYPIEDYHELSIVAVNYAGGLPLALEVLGSYLLGRRIFEWKSALENLQKVPHHQIQKILRTSFDSLDNNTVDIFLDISCFFIGMNKDYVSIILYSCGFSSDIGISILIQRSLLTIDTQKKLRMHNLIRDMGREIIREKSPNNRGKRSRLWFREDALNVLQKDLGSDAVEGLVLNLSSLEDVHLKTEAFAVMKNLRLLGINGVGLTGCYEHLSKELRWLFWHECPLNYLPYLENLAVLDMQHSNTEQGWKENKMLSKLKVLNLGHAKCLAESPNFLQVPCLEILILEGCTSLVKVDESIGHLKRLISLDLEGCEKLTNLPGSIFNIKSLENINLSGCLKLDVLSEHLKRSNPVSLLPSTSGICSLTNLNLSGCNLSEDGIPIDLGSLSSLRYLNLSRNNFRNLPHCISRLPILRGLYLNECTTLQSISELPASLRFLQANGCISMERLLNLSNLRALEELFLGKCHKLVEIQGLESAKNLSVLITMEGCNNVEDECRMSLLQALTMGNHKFFLPGSEVPNWFSHRTMGSSISFHVPSLSEDTKLLVCAVFAGDEEINLFAFRLCLKINNKTRGYIKIFDLGVNVVTGNFENHLFVRQIPHVSNIFKMESGDEVEVSIFLKRHFRVPFPLERRTLEVTKCGIHLQ